MAVGIGPRGQPMQGPVGTDEVYSPHAPVVVAGVEPVSGQPRILRVTTDGRLENTVQGMAAEGGSIVGINPVLVSGRDTGNLNRAFIMGASGGARIDGSVAHSGDITAQNPLLIGFNNNDVAVGTAFQRLVGQNVGDNKSFTIGTPYVQDIRLLYNGSTYDRERGHLDQSLHTNVAFNTAENASAAQTTFHARAILIAIQVDSITGAPGANFKAIWDVRDAFGNFHALAANTGNVFTPVAAGLFVYIYGQVDPAATGAGTIVLGQAAAIGRQGRLRIRNNEGAPGANFFTGDVSVLYLV